MATVAATVDTSGAPVDIDTTATVRFADGAQGQLTVISDLPATWMEQVLIAGSTGALTYEIEPQHPWRAGRIEHYRDGGILQPFTLPDELAIDAAWLAAIRGQGPNPAPPVATIAVTDLTTAIYAAAREQRVLDLAPALAPPKLSLLAFSTAGITGERETSVGRLDDQG